MGERLQQFLLWLRKLGILRYGATSYTYRSGKDMPAHAVLEDVYDEEKDLVINRDFSKKEDLGKKRTPGTGESYCTQCGKKLADDGCRCGYSGKSPKK